MKIVKKAVLTDKDGGQQHLSLFQIEAHVFRWIDDKSGTPFDGVDLLSEHDGIKNLRVIVESDPRFMGVDLTILPVELPPAERAAKRIFDLDLVDLTYAPGSIAVERMAKVIQEETQIDGLIEDVNLLITYEFPRRLHPKKPGLDMTWGGLVLAILECMEKSQKVDLSNLKKQLTEGIEQVKIYSSMPVSKVVN
jgi:hypothetical protein